MAELITDKDGKITGLVSKWSRDDSIREAKDHCNCDANPLKIGRASCRERV